MTDFPRTYAGHFERLRPSLASRPRCRRTGSCLVRHVDRDHFERVGELYACWLIEPEDKRKAHPWPRKL
jgi:hypothetical protein